MRRAVLSDIHGNREALSAVLADCAARGLTDFLVLGDLVGYGPDPAFAVETVAGLAARGAAVVRGNHDEAACARAEGMRPAARVALDWTRERIGPDHLRFLAGLPMQARLGTVLCVHASAHAPQDWCYITSTAAAAASIRAGEARLVLAGHTHVPALYSADPRGVVQPHPVRAGAPVPLLASRRWLAVVGAVGQPRDGNPAAAWAILDEAAGTLEFRRTPYDAAATVAKLRAAGLPESLATRLLRGE
jgi:diadenosine tetraphosphatase ApaH/serine/threonine PP2A family protein phosphatase